jgi:ATP-dependent helicase HrpA
MSSAGLHRLADIERYLSAIDRRLDKLPADPQRDFGLTGRARLVQQRLDEAVAASRAVGAGQQQLSALEEVRWMIEELRVSFFAQSLGTRMPVSEQKISKAINEALSSATTSNV